MEREEALHELRGFIGQLTEGCQEALKTLIPELKESRDEQVRKAIIKSLDLPFMEANIDGTDVTYEEAVAWLEKQKNTEWSEDDKCHLASIIGCIELCNKDTEDAASVLGYYDSDIAWLKSLRPSWKPSEEQIYSLGTVVKGAGENSVGSVAYNLKELYEELKKL